MSEENNCFRDGKVHVGVRKCSTCIFRPGNLMHLQEGRTDGMAADAVAAGSVIVCHKTLYQEKDEHAVCRGFFDVHKNDVQALQLAERLGILEEVELDSKDDGDTM